jgi:hypothetical protein
MIVANGNIALTCSLNVFVSDNTNPSYNGSLLASVNVSDSNGQVWNSSQLSYTLLNPALVVTASPIVPAAGDVQYFCTVGLNNSITTYKSPLLKILCKSECLQAKTTTVSEIL